jgi:hypothetical protein
VFARYAAFRWDAKALAITPAGGCGVAAALTRNDALAAAMADCEAHARNGSCRLYAIGQHLAVE